MGENKVDKLAVAVEEILKRFKCYDIWLANRNAECENCGYKVEYSYSDGLWGMARSIYEYELRQKKDVKVNDDFEKQLEEAKAQGFREAIKEMGKVKGE